MPGQRKLRSAARYGARHLTTIAEDMGSGYAYSRAMRTDMELAITMLDHAPAMVALLNVLVDYVDAGCEDLALDARRATHILTMNET